MRLLFASKLSMLLNEHGLAFACQRKGHVAMRSPHSAQLETPHNRLLYSRRNFLVFCLGFVGISCASAGPSTTASPTAPPRPSRTMATIPAPYHGIYTGHGNFAVW